MGQAKNEGLFEQDDRINKIVCTRRLLGMVVICVFFIMVITIIVLILPNHAQATDFGVAVQHNAPANGIANVTPGIDYGYSVDITNTGTNNTGEDINMTVELDAASVAAGWTVTPSGTTLIPGLEMSSENKTTEIITVRAPSDAMFEDTAIVNISVEVVGHKGEGGCQDSLQLRANVLQVFEVMVTTAGGTTKAGDPGDNMSFGIEITNQGNGNDTFALLHSGTELGEWSLSAVDLGPGESIGVLYNFSIAQDHIAGDIPITLTASSTGNGTAYDTLDITVSVNPIYAFELTTTAPDNTKNGEPGETIQFTLQVKNNGTAADSYQFLVTSVDSTIFTVDPIFNINNLAVDTYGTTQTTVTITAEKADALAGIYPIEITAQSINDPGITQPIVLYVNITVVGAVETTPAVVSDSGLPGDTINYTVRISNYGNAQDTFDLSLTGPYSNWGETSDATGSFIINQTTLSALGTPGSFVDIMVRVTIPGQGETVANQIYDIYVWAHSRNTPGASDASILSTEVEQYVHLILDYAGTGDPYKDYDPNKAFDKFTFRVTNDGNLPEDAISFYINNMPASWDYTVPVIDILDPGQSDTFEIALDIPADEPEGEYDLQAYVTSSDGSFDSIPMPITVNITKPDLAISPSDVTGLSDITYLKGKIGEQVTITARVHNIGHTSADMVQVRLLRDASIVDSETISVVFAGGYKDIEFQWTVVAEQVQLYVEITPLIELNVNNNAITPITLDLRPDLSFEGAGLYISNVNPEPDEIITIEASILNTGGDAEDIVVKFYNGTKLIGTDSISVDYGETGMAVVTWIVPDMPGGWHSIRAEINLAGAKGDGDDSIKTIKVMEDTSSAEPVLEPIGHLVATEKEPFSYTVAAHSADPNETLTFSDDTALFSIDSVTGEISFVPGNEDVGVHVIKITVTNSTGAEDYENVIMTVSNVNDPPTLSPITSQVLTEDVYFSLTILAEDVDSGEFLIFSDNTSLFDINPLTGVIAFTPVNADAGSYTVNISVADSEGGLDFQSILFVVNNENDVPSLGPLWDFVSIIDETFTYDVEYSDEDHGDDITFSDDTELFDIDAESGEISFTPGKEDAGTHHVTITVTDDEGESDSTTVTFTILEKTGDKEPDDNSVWILLAIVIGLIALVVGLLLGKGWKKKPEMQQATPAAAQAQPQPALQQQPANYYQQPPYDQYK